METMDIELRARRIWEDIFPACDDAALAEVIAADQVDHDARPDEPPGLEAVRRTMHWLASVFSDQRFEVEHVIRDGDVVVVHAVHHGRQTGPLMGMPPTGREVAYRHIHILRFQDGKAQEHWGAHDSMTLMRQLGVAPPTGATGAVA